MEPEKELCGEDIKKAVLKAVGNRNYLFISMKHDGSDLVRGMGAESDTHVMTMFSALMQMWNLLKQKRQKSGNKVSKEEDRNFIRDALDQEKEE